MLAHIKQKTLASERHGDSGADCQYLVEQTTSADSRELGTFLHNMAELCLIPAGLLTEAREFFLRAKQIFTHHREDDGLPQVDKLLPETPS